MLERCILFKKYKNFSYVNEDCLSRHEKHGYEKEFHGTAMYTNFSYTVFFEWEETENFKEGGEWLHVATGVMTRAGEIRMSLEIYSIALQITITVAIIHYN